MAYHGNGYPAEDIPMTNQTHYNQTYQDDSLPHDRPTVIDVTPRIGLDERRDSNSSVELEPQHRNSSRRWAATEDRRDVQEMIDALPSRQLEQIADNGSSQHSSLRQRKSSKKRSSFHSGTLRAVRSHDPDHIVHTLTRNDNYMDELDGDQRMTETIRDMQLPLHHKRAIKKDASEIRRQKTLKRGYQPKQIGWFKRTKYSIGMSWMHFKHRMAEFAYSLELWKSHMKKIEGHFGTGVTSYFLFLKWIFLLNIPVFFLTLGFVIIPQVIYRYYQKVPRGYATAGNETKETFTGVELLTGAKWFNNTEMYYGFYTNQAVNIGTVGDYQMKYAYLFTCGGYFFLCLFILARGISRSYKKNYIEGSDTQTFYIVSRVLCSWDYNIVNCDAALLRHKSFYNEMKEFLAGKKKTTDDKKKFEEKCKWFFIRVATNLFVLGSIVGLVWGIYLISDKIKNEHWTHLNNIPVLSEMALPLCVSGIILIVPVIFTFIAKLERYEQPKNELYMNMFRTMLLKCAILVVLVFFWFTKTAEKGKEGECWENLVGQEIYRLVIVDFIFTLGYTFCMEFLRRVFATYCCKGQNLSPEFDISRNTLDLIYSQALCWLGTFYSPLLSFIMIVKLIIIFYVKRVSVLMNCRPSLRPWQAARTHTIFMAILFFFFLMATIAVAIGIFSIDSSHICGPYRHVKTDDEHYYAYTIIKELIDNLKGEAIRQIIRIISSAAFITIVLVALCVGTYYMRIVMIGHREMVTLLRQQLAMEGRDKAYLLRMLQDVSKKKKEKLKPSNLNRKLAPQAPSTPNLNPSPGGRHFARTLAQAAASGPDMYKDSPRSRRRANQNGGIGAAPH